MKEITNKFDNDQNNITDEEAAIAKELETYLSDSVKEIMEGPEEPEDELAVAEPENVFYPDTVSEIEDVEKEEPSADAQPVIDTISIEKEPDVKKRRKKKPVKRKIILVLCIVVLILLVSYFGISFYFKERFSFGSELNGVQVTGMTVEEVEEVLKKEVASYQLSLEERENITEEITASEIGLSFVSDGKVEKLMEQQNSFKWPAALFQTENYQMQATVAYDEKMFEQTIDGLRGLQEENIVTPKDAYPEYQEDSMQYIIVDEIYGNQIKKEELSEAIKAAIEAGESVVSLEEQDLYEKPAFTAESKEVTEAAETMNKYVGVTITHEFGSAQEVLNAERIHAWISLDENWEVLLQEEMVKEYIDEISRKYETFGTTRTFTTSRGEKKKIPPGDYGWSIKRQEETEQTLALIKSGESASREPSYRYRAASHDGPDYGNTYVEIDLTGQHMWFYKNGKLIVETDVVTGNVSKGNTTPPGIFGLTYKERDATLRGEDYETPVDYWMPFNKNIGIHDASWRSSFGGNIYKTSGSNGCINTPPSNAKIIYEGISAGDPVICYN